MDRTGLLAFCPARFGPEIAGGAEIVLRRMAHLLQVRGWDVEILTTCATDHHSWRNVLPAGASHEGGLRVRRFPVVDDHIPERQDLERRILGGEPLTVAEQQRWMNAGMRVPELFHHILDVAEDYRALVFTPYPFWVTFACSQVAPERSVLWTCLHDEPYAHLELFRPVLSGVGGLFFQSRPEHDLAHRLVPDLAPHAEVGCGVEVPERYDPEGFRERYGIRGRFLLYAGRREGAKGWDGLLDAFAATTGHLDLPFSLVTMGVGEVRPPAAISDRVVDLGFLPDRERDNAFAAADAYLQPSRYEAFSRTMMEAWLAGTPVVADAGSAVTAWHCRRSGAGLLYSDVHEFGQCLQFLADAPEAAARLAEGGREYVLADYRWDAVLDRVEACLDEWTTGKS
ncbi:glycosyltransferase family 4 protein [Pseudonocardia acidicola]|uniref:Glycosyltransferase family 4 protein n=1 Tax=Pseudonocardia acidicola TaxID=2724939 RepID=A0ABX1S956_9PSEU|nr:glycosyltransferase family 4 protein [Pseudonocardia acidicola]NMH97412.1 glycosyltransferase family 4 protein [Pseudonocardia acidicola]